LENLLGNGWNYRRIYLIDQLLKLVMVNTDSNQYLMRTELKNEIKLLIRNLGIQFSKRIIKV